MLPDDAGPSPLDDISGETAAMGLGDRLGQSLCLYGRRVRLFRPNARRYLLFTILTGVGFGIYRLLFNFYVLSLGYDEALLGNLLTTTCLVALLSALPAGYLSDRLGRKPALLLSTAVNVGAVMGMVLWPHVAGFYAMNGLIGLGQSLSDSSGADEHEQSRLPGLCHRARGAGGAGHGGQPREHELELRLGFQPDAQRMVTGPVRLCPRLSGDGDQLCAGYLSLLALFLGGPSPDRRPG